MTQIIATQKYLRMSPRKLRLVVDMVKHLPPTQAVEVLPYMQKRAAMPLHKVIKTAIANAQVKGISAETLKFSEIQIGQGPRLKRFRAGSRGRYKPYTRDMSHIRVVLTEKIAAKEVVAEEVSKPAPKKRLQLGNVIKKADKKKEKK